MLETLAYSGQTLGLSNTFIFWRIRIPYCRQGILAGTVLAFARAIGEYGATSMIAGYTPGKTATISTTVYQMWRTDNDALAFRWVMVNIAISTVVLLAVNMLERRNARRPQSGSFHLRSRFEVGGETLALLGASGCGKSMTLKCIAGIERPDRGQIILDGETLFDSEKHIDLPPQKRRVGYLFQQYALFPSMTAEQNILCCIRSGTRAEKRRALAEAVRMFRLEGLEKKLPAQLSGGQQQRVALARILCSRPKAILLDEPFSALDGFLKWNLELELSDLLSRFNGPIVWVSHDLGECRRNCSQVCVMENGLASRIMGLDELIRRPDSLSAARLAGYKNFFPCRACEGGVFVPDWGLTLRGISAGPEHSLLAVGPDAVDLSGKDYAFRVLRVIQDVGHNVVLLRPDGASENAPVLRIKAAPENVPQPGSILTLSLRPASLLLF